MFHKWFRLFDVNSIARKSSKTVKGLQFEPNVERGLIVIITWGACHSRPPSHPASEPAHHNRLATPW